MRTAPELTEDLANRIDQTLCDPKSNNNHLDEMEQVIQIMPEFANEKGLACIFSLKKKKWDFIVWSMLDARKLTGLPKTVLIYQIEQSATGERTKDGFLREDTSEVYDTNY